MVAHLCWGGLTGLFLKLEACVCTVSTNLGSCLLGLGPQGCFSCSFGLGVCLPEVGQVGCFLDLGQWCASQPARGYVHRG